MIGISHFSLPFPVSTRHLGIFIKDILFKKKSVGVSRKEQRASSAA